MPYIDVTKFQMGWANAGEGRVILTLADNSEVEFKHLTAADMAAYGAVLAHAPLRYDPDSKAIWTLKETVD